MRDCPGSPGICHVRTCTKWLDALGQPAAAGNLNVEQVSSLLERKTDAMVASDRRKWLALALLSVVQFMVVLDIAIVNVALPSIQVDLGFSQENLQWVISAYALVFGGFLLLGGRAADLLGRRRIFLAGIVLFTLASLLAGLAWSEASLISARALQGLGAAVITPAASVDPLDDVHRRPRAQHRARRLGRRRRLRRGCGRSARRRPHGRSQLGVDLLRQHPRRRDGVHPGADPAQGEPRRERQGVRRPRCGARDGRAVVARLRDHPGGPGRLARGRDAWLLRGVARACSSASSPGSCATRSRSCASGSCAPGP